MSRPYHVTLIHPCVGRRAGERRYMATWKMEPLPVAAISALMPTEVERRFFDDRLEVIDYDAPTDLVAMSVETYTAKRAYQIASEYRRRGVPVVMGGYHATLCTAEVERYADSVVVGEAEASFPQLLDDYRSGTPQKVYRAASRPDPSTIVPDRSLFAGKGYLPIRLIEFARGCRYHCDFCAVQSFHRATQTHRRVDQVVAELATIRRFGQLVFFIDDNLASDLEAAKELMRALIPLKIRWVSQASIDIAFDDEALDLMRRSGCQGVLVGFESLDGPTLRQMAKGFNATRGGAPAALERFRQHRLRIYGTFVFGYDHDTVETFDRTLEFAEDQGLFIAAFNHITPFPGTPLYQRLADQQRLLMEPWWLDDGYRYGMVPFRPTLLDAEELATLCLAARKRFYSWRSIARRLRRRVNHRDPWMAGYYLATNALHHIDIGGRHGLPLGDAADTRPLIEASVSITVEVVDPNDNAADHAAATLLGRPMDGSIRLALTRDPSPLGSAELVDRPPRLILARDGDRPLGMAMAWRRPVFLEGAAVEIGYLGQLRLERPLGRGPLTRGFDLALAGANDVALTLTTIARDNHRARRLLERGLRGVPTYHPIGDIATLVFPTRLSGGKHARPANEDDAPAIQALLDQQGTHFTLCPRWPSILRVDSDPSSPPDGSRIPDPGFPLPTPSSLPPGPGSRLPGPPSSIHCHDAPDRSESTRYPVPGTSAYRTLTLDDFLVVNEGSRLVGACALWDQRGFKQTVIAGYTRLLRALRPISNALARIVGRAGLPTPGTIVPLAFLSHFVAPTPAAAHDLVRSALHAARPRGLEWLSLSLSAKDPLLPTLVRLPHRRYDTRLYAVGEVEPSLVSAIAAGFRLEGALL